MIEFETTSSFDLGSYIRVIMIVETQPSSGWFKRQRKRIRRSDKGWIVSALGGDYQYYESQTRVRKFKFSDANLDELKEKIKSHLEGN